jgi:hypothetical protein
VELLLLKWHDIIDHVGKADPLSKSAFLCTAPLKTNQTKILVGYDPEFESEKPRLEDSRAKLALGRSIERHLGRLLTPVYQPLKSDDRRPLPADKPVSDSSADNTQELSGMMKWYANPVVKTVVDAFNGEITDIRE